MNTKRNRGVALLLVVIIMAVIGLGGVGTYELHKAHEKNTAKAVVNTVTEVQAAKQVSDALSAANAKADAAQADLEAAHKTQVQTIAGYAEGAKISLDQDPDPSLQSKIAALMVDNALDVTGPASAAQVAKFTAIIKELAAANAQLVAQNTNLKNVNLVTTQSLDAATKENIQVKGNLALAEKTAGDMTTARDLAVKQTVIANNVAASSAKQIELIQISIWQRVKAWCLGLGMFGIAGLLLLFAILPSVAIMFPELAPAIKSMTGFVLGLWHKLASKAVAEVEALHTTTKVTLASTQTQLAVETASHAATKATLATTQAQVVAVAIAPTVADQLVASMAATNIKSPVSSVTINTPTT